MSSTRLPLTQTPVLPEDWQGIRLPESYNQTRLVLLPRDPHWMFTYWEVSQSDRDAIRRIWGQEIFERSACVLRVHDVTGISFSGENSNHSWDVRVPLEARRWYLEAQNSGRSYCVELGLLSPDGKFILLARSNVVTLPVGRIAGAEEGQDQWMSVNENFEKVLELSGGTVLGSGSMEVSKILAHRFELLQGVSSWSGSPRGAWKSAPEGEAGRNPGQNFWLLADTTLLIRGQAPPDAKVTLQGHTLTIQPDGSFIVQLPLSDGTWSLPIVAESADGSQKKELTFTIERKTQKTQ